MEESSSSGTYKLSDSTLFTLSPVYTLNSTESKCTNGGTIKQDSETKAISINITSSDSCDLYYDYTEIKLSDYIISLADTTTTPDFSTTATTDEGIFAAPDDYGTSYYFRGAVENNYVYFAGFYWRIVRVNVDGSIRLIYDGTSVHANGEASTDRQIGTSQFNSNYDDPTYVGYTYKTDFSYISTSTNVSYTNISSTTTYTFYDNYSCNDDTNLCTPTGNSVSGTWSSIYSEYGTSYPYTCWGDGTSCKIMSVVQGYNSETSAQVTYIGYITSDIDNLTYGIENEGTDTDSTIKTTVDKWYYQNIYGTEYEDYLSDTLFCNDRSYYNDNSTFLLTNHTYFRAYDRNVSKKTPSLVCPNQEDEYTVNVDQENDIGNGNLSCPVGLLTIDEAAFAGGKFESMNQLIYLYTGSNYWTMSPYTFYADTVYATVCRVVSTGNLYFNTVTIFYGVRPVINLKSDVIISNGNGTYQQPFTLSI